MCYIEDYDQQEEEENVFITERRSKGIVRRSKSFKEFS